MPNSGNKNLSANVAQVALHALARVTIVLLAFQSVRLKCEGFSCLESMRESTVLPSLQLEDWAVSCHATSVAVVVLPAVSIHVPSKNRVENYASGQDCQGPRREGLHIAQVVTISSGPRRLRMMDYFREPRIAI